MAQPQPQMPPRAYSPAQHSPSAATTQAGFALPPNKRPRLSPGPPSQPDSPYATSPYAVSPGTVGTPTTSTTSPTYFNAQPQPPNNYATPYTNGHSTPTLSLPESRPTPPPALPTPQLPTAPSLPYTTATLAPGHGTNGQGVQTPGAMGPPSRPPDKPQKEYEYDVTDSLAGTGIDLRAEEQYMSELYALDPQVPDSRTGFGQYAPGNKASFYGAGPANQPAQPTGSQNQSQLAAESAEKAWQESAKRLAHSRSVELSNPFLVVSSLHRKADKIAKEYGIQLNLDLKTNQQQMGRMKLPEEFPKPQVTVTTKTGPNGTLVHTSGSWIPQEAYLVDQLALLSIAAKHRLRGLVEESNRIAVTRQKSSHGEVPEEWAEAAAPLNAAIAAQSSDEPQRTGAESAVSPRTNPLKRPIDTTNAAESGSSQPAKLQKTMTNNLTVTVRDVGRGERDWEEARLRKRNARREGTAEAGSTPSRSGSVAPGTPGSVAPESEKALTKKESKKAKAARDAEASSHVNQNLTSSLFVGMPRTSSLFGKKAGGKAYAWMTGGGGSSTPKRAAQGSVAPGTPGTPTPTSHALTVDGRNRLGTWREDQVKGKNIQLRDWVVALEGDSIEKKALQDAYDKLEVYEPK